MIKIAGRMDDLFTAGAEVWDILSHVLMNIDKYIIRLLLSSRVSAYNGTPILKLLLKIIERKRWGLKPSCIHDENGKWNKIITYAPDCLTQRKAEVKKLLDVSIEDDTSVNADSEKTYKGKNIIELCNALHQIGKKLISTGTDVVVTPEMCARIALLRLVFLENPTGKYWSAVDQTLANIRKKAGGKLNKVSG
ncbi:uncharacterized protein LAESUDRAFT_712495 [Laetiporus sulphureus 93-53]|uniref:Uncharacterized protein n=1 Tax=Laetiporus sulphureus 93-53 TaxID=1314785 RepID=A0A165FF39_9APHY|nr:uncharacterized protein LAESUDRAFT_712495 [Laetiporus sulphureus 93-53]KZT08874.1 hypothetical protein LAESUDRAFT_712495 [Laetiporus sulphureus 93-53]